MSILNRKAEPGSVLVKPTDDAAKDMAARQDDNVRTKVNESRKEVKCMHGLNVNKDTCGHCTPNGACDMSVCACIPHKYQMCPYKGDGFIDCKDA